MEERNKSTFFEALVSRWVMELDPEPVQLEGKTLCTEALSLDEATQVFQSFVRERDAKQYYVPDIFAVPLIRKFDAEQYILVSATPVT